MPSERNRSKEDTWTTDELNKALKRDDGKRHRDKDEQGRKDRHRDEMNGDSRRRKDDDERRHHRDKDDERRSHRDEEERERQRRERREKREGKGRGDEEKKKREHDSKRHKLVIEDDDDDDGDRRKLDDDRRREEEREKRRQQREADEKKRRHKGDDEKRRHRDDDDREKRRSNRDEDDRERRKRDDDDREKRRRRDDDDDERHRRRDDDDREKRRSNRDDDDREKRRSHRDRDEDDRERRRRKDEEREQRHAEKNREREEERERRRREKEEEREQRHRKRDEDDGRERRRHKDRDEDGRDHRKDRRLKEDNDDEDVQIDEDERERQRRERREKRDGGKSEKDKRRKDEEEQRRQRDKEREERKAREREEEEERKAKYRAHEGGRKQQEEEDEYNYDDDDFEDYEEDFEEEDDDDEGNQDNEIGDLLKALDKENERLLEDSRATSGRNKNRIIIDDDEGYGRRNRYDESDDEPEQPKVSRSRTLINFVGAKKRVMTNQANSIMGRRAQDLLQMVSLDTSEFDLFDMPPVKEYDLYIRSFGRSDTTQAYVQTGDDDIEREVQTDEIDCRQKWTQHPPEDFAGCGRGDGEKDIEEEEESAMNKQPDLSRFSKFVQKACQAISIMLEESEDKTRTDVNANKSQVGLSEGYTRLSVLSILKGRHVQFAQFSPTQPNMFITAYSKSKEEDDSSPTSRRGVVCVWNANEPSYPYRILICESQPTCCCFSPYQTSLAFAGMEDGSICVWDLRESSTMHRSVSHQDMDFVLRSPTYDTASVLESENHHSPVTTLNPVAAYSMSDPENTDTKEESGAGLSFQLVSCEEQGCLNFWVVAEINNPDMAGSETDLGMSPGGRIKLVHSSVINLKHPTRYKMSGDSFKTFEMQLSPTDPNHIYVGTDSGYVLHCVRFGNRAFPSSHSTMSDAPVDVNSLDFSPFGHPCFLVTSNDGTVNLYSTKQEHPLVSWPSKIWDSRNLLCVRWSRSRPCVFYVVDDSSRLYTFDILEGDAMPVRIDTLSQERVTDISFSSDNKSRLPQMLVSLESGETEIHTIAKEFREYKTLENDFLPTYLSRF